MTTDPTHSAKKSSSKFLNRQVGLYSLAAAAAGVSLLALVQPAAGEVVVTKKTIPIPMTPFGTPNPVKISMANNGIDNFSFSLTNAESISYRALNVDCVRPRDNAVIGTSTFIPNAFALPRGAKIGPTNPFLPLFAVPEGSRGSGASRYSFGRWAGNLKDHYLGVGFKIDGQTHYGWIRLTVTTHPHENGPLMSATITAYAYETVPNKPIYAGTTEKPTAEVQVPEDVQSEGGPSLGMLALGAEGLTLWRREGTAN